MTADETDLNHAIADLTSRFIDVQKMSMFVNETLRLCGARARLLFAACEPVATSLSPAALSRLGLLVTFASGLSIRWLPPAPPAERLFVLQQLAGTGIALDLHWLTHRSVDAYWDVLGEIGNGELQTILPYTVGVSAAQWRELLRRRRPAASRVSECTYASTRFNDACNPRYAESDDVIEVLLDEWLRTGPRLLQISRISTAFQYACLSASLFGTLQPTTETKSSAI